MSSKDTSPYIVDSEPAASAPQPGSDWRDFLYVVFERRWILITAIAVALAGGYYQARRTIPLYKATARLQMDAPRPKAVQTDEVIDVNIRDMTFLQTQIGILQSRSLAEKAAQALKLDQRDALLPKGAAPADLARRILSMTRVENVRGTRMVDITVTHTTPELTAEVANGIADSYIQRDLDVRMEASLDALKWLQRQAEQYKENLDRSEQALQDYREQTLATSLIDQKNAVLAQLEETTRSQAAAQTERLGVETVWQKIDACRKAGGDLTQVDVIAEDPQIKDIRAEILDKQTAIQILRGRYLAKHPRLVAALDELEKTEEKLKRACETVAEGINARRVMADAKIKALGASIVEQQKQAFELERKLMAYNDLLRNVEADRELYNSVLARMKETSVAGKVEDGTVRLLDRATVPAAPFNLRLQNEMIQYGVMGVVFGIGLCFLIHFADDRIRRTDDLERHTGLSVLAVIPRIRARSESSRLRVSQEDRHSVAAEAFRTLRASLSLIPAARNSKSLLITSATAGAGKSLVSANLAIVNAQSGLKTLLIDADLRRPRIHLAFNTGEKTGLSHVLAGDMPWRDAVVHSDVQGLDVITAGRIPPHPAELLGSETMKALLAEAAAEYDRIILDSPPIFGVSDPLILLPLVGGLIFVARFNKSRRRNITHAMQKLRGNSTPVLGVIMNNISLRGPSGYYYYYYGHHYGSYEYSKRKA